MLQRETRKTFNPILVPRGLKIRHFTKIKFVGSIVPEDGASEVGSHSPGDVQHLQAAGAAAPGSHAVSVRPRGSPLPRPVRGHRHRVRGTLSSVSFTFLNQVKDFFII